MEVFVKGINALYTILNIKFELFGFVISWWQVFMFGIVASLLIWFFNKLMD